MSARHPSFLLAFFAGILLGCGAPSLGTPWLIDRPRVLALVAEPPEANLNDRITVRAAIGGVSPNARLVWTLCTRPEEASSTLPLGSFGRFDPDLGCDSPGARGMRLLATRENGLVAFFDVDNAMLTDAALLEGAFGSTLTREEQLSLVARVGLPLVVTVNVSDERGTVRAYKRVFAYRDGVRNHNPPAPRLTFGTRALAGNGTECVPTDQRGELTVAQGERVRIAPATGEEAWLESFSVLDNEAQRVELQESPFYSFFTTGGTMELGRARMPDRDPAWVAPNFPGEVLHWLVVRDGRGGASACRYRVVVQ